MIIGVISDSHDNLHALKLVLRRLLEHRVELVVHLGDIISPFTVKLMKEVLGDIKVMAVKGNNDGDLYQLLALFTQYGWAFKVEPGTVELRGKTVLLLHGYGNVNETVSFVNALTRSLKVDMVLYGHTHKVSVEKIDGKLVLNPGEVCGYLSGSASYAIVDLKSLKAEIAFLEKEW
ncbi:MAG: metallophosphoesterase [Desulfurococcaceae archaeon]